MDALTDVVRGLVALGAAGLLALLSRLRFGRVGGDDGPPDNGLD